MKLKQHLGVGHEILNENIIYTFKVNKRIYLLGTIIPDINFIYPAHRLNTTEKRFYRKLKIVNKSKMNIIKSFNLGIITHYLCDYFCYPHNINSIGLKHKIYENKLYKYYKINNKDSNYEFNLNIKPKYKYSTFEDYIVSQIKSLNSLYIDNINNISRDCDASKRYIENDINFSNYVTKYILQLIQNKADVA